MWAGIQDLAVDSPYGLLAVFFFFRNTSMLIIITTLSLVLVFLDILPFLGFLYCYLRSWNLLFKFVPCIFNTKNRSST